MIEGTCLCGAVRWTFRDLPESATACNCTACRRYGCLWAYGWEGEDADVTGVTTSYARGKALTFHFCPTCGCVTHYRALRLEEDGRRKFVVNLRMAEPDAIAGIPIAHFDGLDSFDDLPMDGRCVKDLWF